MGAEPCAGGTKRGCQRGMFRAKKLILVSIGFFRCDDRFIIRVVAYRRKVGIREKRRFMIALWMITDDDGSTRRKRERKKKKGQRIINTVKKREVL
jgi:hypothetical protein